MAEMVPSITPEMEKGYRESNRRFRERPPMTIV
jgi:hypothetical protein